jgi:nucleoside 2-deoxyribosyltransferase
VGYDVFVPHRDVVWDSDRPGEQAFSGILMALEKSCIVVANLSGSRVDEGVAWVLGYAAGRGKALLGLRSDDWELNPSSPIRVVFEESV